MKKRYDKQEGGAKILNGLFSNRCCLVIVIDEIKSHNSFQKMKKGKVLWKD